MRFLLIILDESHGAEEDANQQVIAEYKVFWNHSNKHIMVLQFPNQERNHPYNASTHQKPLELRIKPKSGLVES